jgi:hypothetical protein
VLTKRIVALSILTCLFVRAQDKPASAAPERQPSAVSTQPNQNTVGAVSDAGPAPGLPDLRGPWHFLNAFYAITQSGENLTINEMEDGHWPPATGHPPRPIFEGVIGKTGELRGRGAPHLWELDKSTWRYDSGAVKGSQLRLNSGLILDRVEVTPEAKGSGRDIDLNGSWQGQVKTSAVTVITQGDLTTEGLWPDGSSFRGFTTTSRTIAITASLKTSAANAFGFVVPATKKVEMTLSITDRDHILIAAPGYKDTALHRISMFTERPKIEGVWQGRPNGDSQPPVGDYDVSESASKVTVRLLAAGEIDHTIYEGTFETNDSAGGRISDGKLADDTPRWSQGHLTILNPDHLKLSSGLTLTRASESDTLFAREAHRLSLVPLPARPFDLNGRWRLGDRGELSLSQQGEAVILSDAGAGSKPTFQGRYVSNPAIPGQGVSSESRGTTIKYVEKTLVVVDPDHLRYGAEMES